MDTVTLARQAHKDFLTRESAAVDYAAQKYCAGCEAPLERPRRADTGGWGRWPKWCPDCRPDQKFYDKSTVEQRLERRQERDAEASRRFHLRQLSDLIEAQQKDMLRDLRPVRIRRGDEIPYGLRSGVVVRAHFDRESDEWPYRAARGVGRKLRVG